MARSPSELYDLVIFEIDATSEHHDAAVARVAELLGIDPPEVDDALAFGSRVVTAGLTHDLAQSHFEALLALGVRCNLRPSTSSGRTLSLEPMSLECEFACPRCGHEHIYLRDEEPPETCTSCGLVFAKYDKVQADAAEREQIRRSLLAQKAHLDEQSERDSRETEAAERRARIEAELRRELGIPRAIASRKGLLAMTAGVLAIGIGVGVGTTLLLRSIGGDGDALQAASTSTGSDEGDGDNGGADNPGLDAHRVLATLDAAPSTDAATPGDMAALAAPRSTPAGNLDALKTDALYERDLAIRADALLAAGKGQRATALLGQVADRSRAIQAVTDATVRRATTDGASMNVAPAFELLAAAVEEMPADSPTRVADLAHVVRGQIGAGLADAGAARVEMARQWARQVTDPAARVAAHGVVADLLTRLGNRDDATRAFATANEALAGITDRATRIGAVVQLARSYADAGSTGTAALLVEVVTLSATRIPDPARRAAALREIALFHTDSGNTKSALLVAATIDNANVRAELELSLVESLLASGRLAAAIEVADTITVPAYRARAFGRLAIGQHTSDNALFRDLAPRTLQLARSEADRARIPADQAIVLSELARAARALGDAAASGEFFADAERIAAAIEAPETRHAVLSVLAGHLARAERLEQARRLVSTISDPATAVAVSDDVARVQATLQLVQDANADAATAGTAAGTPRAEVAGAATQAPADVLATAAARSPAQPAPAPAQHPAAPTR